MKKYTKEDLPLLEQQIQGIDGEALIHWALETFSSDLVLASSFSIEDQVVFHYLWKKNRDFHLFTLDTGRLPQATYDVIEATRKAYSKDITLLFPRKEEVQAMVQERGPNLFYNSVENRKLCCGIRKVNPLNEHLAHYRAWITGLRRSQSVTRGNLKALEWDDAHNMFKINPLLDWSQEDVWKKIRENSIPYNRLQDEGYPSIGCEPCTRAVKEGEDERAGRWWWENPDKKECGLHTSGPARWEIRRLD